MDARFQLGSLYLLSRNVEKANEQAESILTKNPNDMSGHLLMSSILAAKRDLDKAISEARKAIELDPKKIDSYLTSPTFTFSRMIWCRQSRHSRRRKRSTKTRSRFDMPGRVLSKNQKTRSG